MFSSIMAQRRSVVFDAPYQISIVEETVPIPQAGEVLVATIASAISPGTEMLVYRGQLPAEMTLDATITALANVGTTYPLRYGYALIGKVIAIGDGVEANWLDQLIFAFHPHSSHFVTIPSTLMPIPKELSVETALFYPNMETAVTFVLDGAPAIGERVCVVGAGIVGLLTTALLARFPLAGLTVIDPLATRRQLALRLGANAAYSPEECTQQIAQQADLTYELSGNPAALDTAIQCTGFAGRVVIGSWYGKKQAPIDLGGYFHRSRIRLIGSQVSSLPPERSGRWDRERRSEVTWRMLKQIDTSALITHRFAVEDAAAAYQQVDERAAESIQVLLEY